MPLESLILSNGELHENRAFRVLLTTELVILLEQFLAHSRHEAKIC